jgi:O-antigen/teichoic acid export membrane protein
MIWQGYYDISITLAGIILFALGTMSYIAIPEATDSTNRSLNQKGGLGDVTRAFFCLAILFSVIICFYPDYIVIKLFSIDYLIAGQYLPIMTIGFIFLYIQTFIASVNLSTINNSDEFFPLIIGGVALLPFSYFLTIFLINEFRNLGYGNGFVGAYVSTTLTLIIWTVFTIILSHDRSPLIVLFEKGDRLFIIVLITSATIFFLQPAPFIGICIFIILYTLLILLSGYINIHMFMEVVHNK